METTSADLAAKRLRQKRTMVVLAIVLIASGTALLFFLKRAPLPMRMLAGLGDIFAGLVLLVLVRQKSQPPPASTDRPL